MWPRGGIEGTIGPVGRSSRRSLRVLSCGAAIALGLGASACGTSSSPDHAGRHPDYHRALAGAPKPLAQLYGEANRLLSGGVEAFQERLAEVRGHPVVVNKWASWCGPCREEFPWFQDLSAKLGTRIAFVGVDSNDSPAAARTFLNEFPVPYPSYSDPDQDIARYLKATVGFPATVFYDARGQVAYVRQGQYASEADLAADVRRYAQRR
jgi:cytochrome c biogenesis protein CcmG, thiol:disulfide interchange protein DsbE